MSDTFYVEGCVFCAIGQGRARDPQRHIEWAMRAYIMEPINPVVPGHLLVIPYRHSQDFAYDWQIASDAMYEASRFVNSTDYGQCNLITSKGEAASQTVFHLHLHIIPRKDNDGLTLPWTDLGLMTETDETFELLRPHQRAQGLRPMHYTRERLVGPWTEWHIKEDQ